MKLKTVLLIMLVAALTLTASVPAFAQQQGDSIKVASINFTLKCANRYTGFGGVSFYGEGSKVVLSGIVLENGIYQLAAGTYPAYGIATYGYGWPGSAPRFDIVIQQCPY